MRTAPKTGYDFEAKANYREQIWSKFAESVDDVSTAKALLMPSLEGLEIPVALKHGFKEENLFCVDKNNEVILNSAWVSEYPKVKALISDVTYVGEMIKPKTIDVANLDLCGCLSVKMTKTIKGFLTSGCMKDICHVAITMVKGREEKEIADLRSIVSELSSEDSDRIKLISKLATIGSGIVYDIIAKDEYRSASTMAWGILKVISKGQILLESPEEKFSEVNEDFFATNVDGRVFVSKSEIVKGYDLNGNKTVFTKEGGVIKVIDSDPICSHIVGDDLYRVKLNVQKVVREKVGLPAPEPFKVEPEKIKKRKGTVSIESATGSNGKRRYGFTEEQEELIIEMVDNGHKVKDIAEHIKKGYSALRSKVASLKKEGRIKKALRRSGSTERYSNEEDNIIIENHAKGMHYKDIAAILGRTEIGVATRMTVMRSKGIL